MSKRNVILLLLVVGIGAMFRFIGINWDQNTHLHPDERFLTMVATSVRWPGSIQQYFDTAHSPANPQNNTYSFYVYGTYPMLLTKYAAQLFSQDSYNGIPAIGRTLAGIADLFTLVVVFLIAKQVFDTRTGIYAAFCYAVMVLPIQLSHFFTVDPYVTLFITVALWRMIQGKFDLLTGAVLALAAGAKISALLVVPMILAGLIITKKKPLTILGNGLLLTIGFFLTLRIVYPYLFDGWKINPLILANWKELESFDTPTTTFPPGLQWYGVPFWQPTWDLLVWGLGLPLAALTTLGIVTHLMGIAHRITHPKELIKKYHGTLLLLTWIVILLVYQSLQYAKPMRYLWPMYPILAVFAGTYLASLRRSFITLFICCLLLIYPLMYLHIYLTPTTRVTASEWMYSHIPHGTTIAWESWDDPLPITVNQSTPTIYHTVSLPVFDPDSPEKWQKISDMLTQSGYVVLSSDRGYGAMGRVMSRYPQTYQYYKRLFDGSLGFIPVAQFTSRPMLPIPHLSWCLQPPGFGYGHLSFPLLTCSKNAVSLIDDGGDETFTVYDHPKVILFKKVRTDNLRGLL